MALLVVMVVSLGIVNELLRIITRDPTAFQRLYYDRLSILPGRGVSPRRS
jgi:hypothetical protein